MGDNFKPFLEQFYQMNRCVGKGAFKELWKKLLDDFPHAASYLDIQLGGQHMERWGLPWQVLR